MSILCIRPHYPVVAYFAAAEQANVIAILFLAFRQVTGSTLSLILRER
jgi:hypothetical protein